MEKLKIGHKYQIHSYKHNGQIYKSWDEAILLHFDFNEGVLIVGNNCTTVMEKDGHTWKTKEPAILFFFLHKWYNIVGQYKEKGICYYCNIASPIIIEDNTIKYIDYDLDLRVFPNGSFKILDRMEYRYHKKQMHYSSRLDFILKYELGNLIEMVRAKEDPFNKKTIEAYHQKYIKLVENENQNKTTNKE